MYAEHPVDAEIVTTVPGATPPETGENDGTSVFTLLVKKMLWAETEAAKRNRALIIRLN